MLISIFPWRRLNFNDFLWLGLYELFLISSKYARLECISPYNLLLETFASNQTFISNHNQTI